jgi:hypothetical protein
MVRIIYILNESNGKLEDEDEKEHIPEISEWIGVMMKTMPDKVKVL